MPWTTQTLLPLAQARVFERFENATNFQKLLSVLVAPLQEVEDAIATLMGYTLDTATGVHLKRYGDLVGRTKLESWTEAEFRRYIRLKIKAMASDNTPAAIIDLARDMRPTGETEEVVYTPRFPAGYRIEIPNVPTAEHDQFVELIGIATGAGIRAEILFWETANAPLTFDTAPGTTYGFDNGVFVEIRVPGE